MEKIKTFTDLIAWQEGHKLVLQVYEILKTFPKEEKFALTDQLKRAVVSVTSNVAEGFSRKTSKEKERFYKMAMGSLTEVQNQLIVAKDVNYINLELFEETNKQAVLVSKLICGLIRYLKD